MKTSSLRFALEIVHSAFDERCNIQKPVSDIRRIRLTGFIGCGCQWDHHSSSGAHNAGSCTPMGPSNGASPTNICILTEYVKLFLGAVFARIY
jgi:hypothetical protein